MFKKNQYNFVIITIAFLVLGLSGCQFIQEVMGIADSELLRIVFVEPESKTLPTGSMATYEIRAIISDSHGQEEEREVEDVIWSSSDDSVCIAYQNEPEDEWHVLGVSEGTATIEVTKDSVSGSLEVMVIEPVVGVFNITPGGNETYYVGTPQQFSVMANGNGAEIPDTFDITSYVVTWGSNNESIATINAAGIATFIESGQVEFTATLPTSILTDSTQPASKTINNLEVKRLITVPLNLADVPSGTPLIFSGLFTDDGQLAAMFPVGTSSGSATVTMVAPSGDLFYHPSLNLSTEASIGTGAYSLHVIADMDGNTIVGDGDRGAIVSVTATEGEPAVAQDLSATSPLVDEALTVSNATFTDDTGITAFWLTEGSNNIIDPSTVYDIEEYIGSGDNKPYSAFPEGVRSFCYGQVSGGGGSVNLGNSFLTPGTYDLCLAVDIDHDLILEDYEYLIYIEAITIDGTGTNIDITAGQLALGVIE